MTPRPCLIVRPGKIHREVIVVEIPLNVQLLSADTFGTLERIASELGVEAQVVAGGQEKARALHDLGAGGCAAIGNGANDRTMLATAALGIAVIGPEGAASSAVAAADVVCVSITDALDLLLEDRVLIAALRA